jgi:hypothetical protein
MRKPDGPKLLRRIVLHRSLRAGSLSLRPTGEAGNYRGPIHNEVIMTVRNVGIQASGDILTHNVHSIARSAAGRAAVSAYSPIRALPSFFIIGPPRTGTTWLHEILAGPTVLPNPTKETRFFDKHFERGVKWYLSHFPPTAPGEVVGEVAPTYFASAEARQRIANLIPQAKIVCIFRNPVERVVSLYRLKRAYAMLPWSFEQALVRDPELMQSSNYVANFTAWQAAFGPGQVLATVYDDMKNDRQGYVDDLADFIGIPRFRIPDALARHVNDIASMTEPRSYYRTRGATMIADWCKARRLDRFVAAVKKSRLRRFFLGGGNEFPELPRDVMTRLSEIFRPEVEALETTLNRDLSAWKSPVTRESALAA